MSFQRSSIPTFENEAISIHLRHILDCRFSAVPVEVTTDSFITYSFDTRPRMLHQYAACLHAGNASLNGQYCNLFIERPCTYFNARVENSCYKRLHNIWVTNYTVDVRRELARTPELMRLRSLERHQKCLQTVHNQTLKCLPALTEMCKESKIRATKVIRQRMKTLQHIVERDPDVRVLWYTRDPRGIVASRLTSVAKQEDLWLMNRVLKQLATPLCEKLKQDHDLYKILAKKYPRNILNVKYEDLVLDHEKILDTIYRFIDLDAVPRKVSSYFRLALGGAGVEGGLLSTLRKNGTQTAYHWQEKLTKNSRRVVERVCGDVIKELGYRL